MTDEADAPPETDEADAPPETDDATPSDLEEEVAQFLRDVDAAHEDYDRGYVDADATLSVVMNHVETLRDTHDSLRGTQENDE
jgi:hypothetical protein